MGIMIAPMETEDIKASLKTLRGEGVKMLTLAREVGVPQSTLSRFLAGRRGISRTTAEKLRQHLDGHPLLVKRP